MAKALSRKVTIYINGKEVEATISSLTAKIKQLENEQKKLPIGTQEYINKSMELKELRAILHEQKAAVNDLGDHWLTMGEKVANASNMIMGVQSIFEMVDLGVGKLKDLAKDAAALDDVYADVMKTTGLTHEQVEKLNEAFKKMDTRTSREQLNQLAYEAGKLGINSAEAVTQFVSASDKINIALGDVLGDGAMVTVGKLTNIYEGVSKTLDGKNLEEKMLAIGSAVNSLGQASTANEGYMVEFMKRLGGIAAQAGMSADQVLGYASALDQNGQAVEMAATAFMKLIQQMVKKPEEFVNAAGVSIEEFRRMMDEDMNGAVLRTLEGMEQGGGFQQLIGMFADMGLDGARAATVVSALAKHLDQVREAQALANQEMMSGSSVINEFNTKNETMQAQAEKAKKRFEEVRIELGNELYPVLIHLQKTGTVFMKWFAALAQVVKSNRWILVSFTTALIALNYAKLKKIATDKLDAVQTRIGNALTKTGTTLSKIHTAEQERAKLAALKLQKARIALASSNKSVTYSIDGMRISSDKMTAARNIDLAITRQQTVANKSLGVAMKAVPWGWVITAVSVLAPLMYKLFTHQSKVNEAEKEAARQYGEAEGKLRVLKERMVGAKEGSAEYLEALNELKSEYPDIIQLHLDERGAIRDLEAAYKDLSAAARQSAYDRVYAEKTSEAYGELAETVTEVTSHLQDVIVNRIQWKKSPSEAVKEELRKFVTEQVRLVSEGKKGVQKALDDIDEFVGKFGGKISHLHGDLSKSPYSRTRSELIEVASAYRETEETVKKYKDALKPDKTEEDPYGYAKMSLEELEKELTSATSSMNDMKRQWELWKKEEPDNPNTKTLGENYLHEKKRVEQLTAAIKKLHKEEERQSQQPTSYNTKETKEEKAARLKREREEKAWNSFSQNYEQVMAKITARTLTGVEKINAEVDASIMKMRQELENVDKTVHPEAAENLERLVVQAERWKAARIDEYLAKTQVEIDKLRKSTAKQGNGEQVDKAAKAVEELRQKISGIDDELMKLYADQAALFPMTDEASRQQLHDVNERIAAYRELRNVIAASVFASIDTSVKNPFEKAIDQDGDKGNFGFTKAREKAMAEVAKQVEEYTKKLNDAIAAEVLMEQAARKSGDVDEAERHRENAEALREQKAELDEVAEGEQTVKEKAEELAKSKAFRSTLQNWADAVDEFGSKALSIFSNINTMLKNQAQQRINDLEDEKDDQIKVLDEQFEQGIISEEQYNTRKQELEDNYKAQALEAEKEDWRRQKAYGYSEAIINAAVAATKLWAGEGTTAYKIGMSALLTAEMATQIAAIKSQPEPRAKGGYIHSNQLYRVGERGREWIASNSLLNDPATAPVIEALEAYQRGNRRALADVPMAQLNMPVVTAAARELGRRNAGAIGAEVVSGWKPSQQKVTVEMPGGDETMQLWRDLAEYLKDPKNRVAVISRQTMKDFEDNENFLRSKARL